jgi:serine protease Do
LDLRKEIKMKWASRKRGLAAKAVSIGVAACAALGLLLYLAGAGSAAEKAMAPTAQQQPMNVTDLSRAFENVAKEMRPSVVNVRSVKRIAEPSALRHMPGDEDQMRQFFGDDFFNRSFGKKRPEEGFQERGLGTGVIVSKDGYILTNAHVARDADQLTVTLSNNQDYKAKVVGIDNKTDLAVLKIDAKNLTPATLGDSDSLRVGEWVLAIGNPFGLTETVTQGIISAKGRANVGISDYEDFIQTDAAINPGNSGGPLVNLNGQVVGINTAIVSGSGGSVGIGFAIPIDMAKSVMNSLIKYGKVERGYMGINIQNLTDELAKSFGYGSTHGVLIGDVTPNSPASNAGLKSGDIITKLNGKTMEDMNQLRNTVASTPPGTEVKVEVFRDGKDKTMEVKLGELETKVALTQGREKSEDLGMTVRELTRDEAKQLKEENAKGVLVTEVEPGSLADVAGIRAGDVVTNVENKPVTNIGELHAAIKHENLKNGIRMQVLTDGVHRFVYLKELA